MRLKSSGLRIGKRCYINIQIEYLFHALFVIFEKEKDCLKMILLAHKVLSHFRFWCQICVLFFIDENSIFFQYKHTPNGASLYLSLPF